MKKKRFLMWLDEDIKEALAVESKKTGYPMAFLIRIALRVYLGKELLKAIKHDATT